jgi:hypothetical protein
MLGGRKGGGMRFPRISREGAGGTLGVTAEPRRQLLANGEYII